MTFVDIKPVDYNLKTVQSLYRQEVLNDNRFPVLSGSISRSGRYRNQEDNTKFCIKVYCKTCISRISSVGKHKIKHAYTVMIRK